MSLSYALQIPVTIFRGSAECAPQRPANETMQVIELRLDF